MGTIDAVDMVNEGFVIELEVSRTDVVLRRFRCAMLISRVFASAIRLALWLCGLKIEVKLNTKMQSE